MKILIVSTFPTHPASAGNRAWILGQAETLKAIGHEVFFLFVLHGSFHAVSDETISATREYWGSNYFEYSLSTLDTLRIKFLSLLSRRNNGYIGCDDKYPLGLSDYVNNLQSKFWFDLCIVNYFFLTKLFVDVKFPKTAVSTHDCFSYRDMQTNDSGTMSLTASEEAKALQRCDYIFALQEEEKIYFQHLSPHSIVLNVFGTFNYHPTPIVGNRNIVILASGINYNVKGISWFIKEVLPGVLEKYPDACLIIGGSVCKQLQGFENTPGVKLLGFVDSPIDLYKMGDVAINPVSEGTGLKIKTFESIAYDKVTIVHPHSLKGIYKPDKAPLLVAYDRLSWLSILENIWDAEDCKELERRKQFNKNYLLGLSNYIIMQYNRLGQK